MSIFYHTDVMNMSLGQGSLIAFSSLSALSNLVEVRPLFVRERSNYYYR